MRPVLYHCSGARGLRVLWLIEEIGIDCDLRLLPFPPRRRAGDYLEINPLGTVPALVDKNVVMTESVAILHYLANRFGPTPLMVAPHEPDFPIFLDYLHHADTTLTAPQTIFVRFTILERERGLEEAGRLYADWFAARLVKLTRRLDGRTFLCAERFTIADIAVDYALFLAEHIGLADRLPPQIRDYHERLAARPAYLRARRREGDASVV